MSASVSAASFLLVDKPGGWTSHDVVAKVRKLAGVKKVGHAGTLDPMATGLVVLGLKRATRLLRFVQAAPKEYIAGAVFGVATDSLDADGAVLERTPMAIDEDAVLQVMERFTGSIAQVPPMVSARKVGGKRLYELAREGIEVEREAREVEIYQLELIDFAPAPYPEITFRTVCSSGTYVRSLADDMARALGGRAHLNALRRVRNGSLRVTAAATIDELEEAAAAGRLASLLLAPAAGLPDLPELTIGDDLAAAVRHGIAFPISAAGRAAEPDGPVRVLDPGGNLLGVYRVDHGKALPEVVMA